MGVTRNTARDDFIARLRWIGLSVDRIVIECGLKKPNVKNILSRHKVYGVATRMTREEIDSFILSLNGGGHPIPKLKLAEAINNNTLPFVYEEK